MTRAAADATKFTDNADDKKKTKASMTNKTSILVVAPEEQQRQMIENCIDSSLFMAHFVSSYAAGIDALKQTHYEIIACHIELEPAFNGTQFLDNAHQISADSVRLLFGDPTNKAELRNAVYRGDAYEYFLLDADKEDIRIKFMHASCEFDNLTEINELKQAVHLTKDDWEVRYNELELVANHEMEELAIFKQIMDTLPIPIMATTREGKVLYANKEIYAAFPSLEKLTPGRSLANFLPDIANRQFEYCIDNDLSVAADPFDLDTATVHLRVYPVSERRADLVVLILQELYATTFG